MNRVVNVYFSPGGTTEKIGREISKRVSNSYDDVDLLREVVEENITFTKDDLLIVSMPVFAGRIPQLCISQLKKLKGNDTPFIANVVYGNRAFEDALLELTDILNENGFVLISGSAIIARHSIFPKVASDRPNSTDIELIDELVEKSLEKMKTNLFNNVSIPGNRPYRESGKLPIGPKGNSNCTDCGICVELCPVGAIPEDDPKETDVDKCINCTACVYNCPEEARVYSGIKYKVASEAFAKKNAKPLDSEIFV
ncbi:MAG: 4Fe-4S binding protein [Tissierellia bacterium]|nr:4Fe-4S binding protein [Tissierellia bacterium]